MKFFLLVLGFSLNISMLSGQSFEGKLTYWIEYGSKVDTHYVYIRGDSIRIDLSKWLDASTSWYFIGKNQHFIYSKWKKKYLEYPIIKPDQFKEVLAYDLKSDQDSITLYYKDKTLNTELNIETTSSSFLKLHPQLKVPFLKGIFIQLYVLNGSGYIVLESKTNLQFNVMGEKRSNRSRLIAIDRTKPSVELFEMKIN
jgi:hypothetical protein